MSPESLHPREEIQELLDGRLDAPARERVERHLGECEVCRLEWRAILGVKTAVRRALAAEEVPTDLNARIRSLLDREDSGRANRSRPRRAGRIHWWPAAAAAGIVLTIALAMTLLGLRNPPARVALDYENYGAGRLPLAVRTEDPRRIERYFADRGISFSTRVPDLRAMGYRLVGGRVLNPDGRERALFVYRGPGGRLLACQMFEGQVRRLPRSAVVRRKGNFTFFVYRLRGSVQVFWQEGGVVCALVSDAPEEEVVRLAFAKVTEIPSR